jgi:hypothetical protein
LWNQSPCGLLRGKGLFVLWGVHVPLLLCALSSFRALMWLVLHTESWSLLLSGLGLVATASGLRDWIRGSRSPEIEDSFIDQGWDCKASHPDLPSLPVTGALLGFDEGRHLASSSLVVVHLWVPPTARLALEMISVRGTFSYWQCHKSQLKGKYNGNNYTSLLGRDVSPNSLSPELFRTPFASCADEKMCSEGDRYWQQTRSNSSHPSHWQPLNLQSCQSREGLGQDWMGPTRLAF